MRRITLKEQNIIKEHQLTGMQKAVLDSLLQAQRDYPQLTTKQYELFRTVFKQLQRNKPTLNYHGKTRIINH